MVPATPRAQPQQLQQQQQQQPDTSGLVDYQGSEWTGRDGQATDGEADTAAGGGADIGDDQFIAGQSLVDDTHDIDRHVAPSRSSPLPAQHLSVSPF